MNSLVSEIAARAGNAAPAHDETAHAVPISVLVEQLALTKAVRAAIRVRRQLSIRRRSDVGPSTGDGNIAKEPGHLSAVPVQRNFDGEVAAPERRRLVTRDRRDASDAVVPIAATRERRRRTRDRASRRRKKKMQDIESTEVTSFQHDNSASGSQSTAKHMRGDQQHQHDSAGAEPGQHPRAETQDFINDVVATRDQVRRSVFLSMKLFCTLFCCAR